MEPFFEIEPDIDFAETTWPTLGRQAEATETMADARQREGRMKETRRPTGNRPARQEPRRSEEEIDVVVLMIGPAIEPAERKDATFAECGSNERAIALGAGAWRDLLTAADADRLDVADARGKRSGVVARIGAFIRLPQMRG
jgi:hypothetical protein